MGETFDDYRRRRLAELEGRRRATAGLVGALVRTVAPPVHAGAAVASDGGGAAVATAEVDPGGLAGAAAAEALPVPELARGDTGGRTIRGEISLGSVAPGRCALTLRPDPPEQDSAGVAVALELVRLVDVVAEERARGDAERARQAGWDRQARLKVLAALERAGADPNARALARARAEAEAETQRRARAQAAAEAEARAQVERARRAEELRRRQAEADAARAAERARQAEELQRRQAEAEAARVARRRLEWEARRAEAALRFRLVARLEGLGADPWYRQRREAERLRVEHDARLRIAAERERREAERARVEHNARLRIAAERERREAERLRVEHDARLRIAAERERREAERARLEAERQRAAREAEVRLEVARAERRRLEWEAWRAAAGLRFRLVARLEGLGADPRYRQRLESERLRVEQEARLRIAAERERREAERARLEAERLRVEQEARLRIAAERERREAERARLEAERRRTAYEAELRLAAERRQREEQRIRDERAARHLRLVVLARLEAAGADPDYRRRRDEAAFRELAEEQSRLEAARRAAVERARLDVQAALDLRAFTKARLKQQGAFDRPPRPPAPLEIAPPRPFPEAVWIAGSYDWNGIAWIWTAGRYERPPQPRTVWIPPLEIVTQGTLVVRPGRWVQLTVDTR
jgi:hypothetical protein